MGLKGLCNVEAMSKLVRFSVHKEMREKFCKTFLDLVIAITLLQNGSITGYRMLTLIYRNFGVLVAPSVLYPMIHSMEKKGLIKKEKTGKRGGVFLLTDNGKSWLIERLNALMRIIMDLERKSGI